MKVGYLLFIFKYKNMKYRQLEKNNFKTYVSKDIVVSHS